MKKTGPKKKSLFRWEALGAFLLFSVLIVGFIALLLEPLLKWSAEYWGYQSLGSEVNIQNIDIDWSNPSVHVDVVQWTDISNPKENLIEIEDIDLNFSWSSLVHFSITSDLSKITGIKVHTKRESPGKVLPAERRVVTMASPTTKKAVRNLKEKTNNDLLSEIINLATNDTDSKESLKNLQENLKTDKLVKDVEKRVKNLESRWTDLKENKIESEETKKLIEKVKSYKFEASNSKELKTSLKTGKDLLEKVKTKYKTIENDLKELESSSKELKNQLKQSPEDFLKDLDYAKSTLGFADVSVDTLTQGLLSQYFALKLQNLALVQDGFRNQLLSNANSYSPVDINKIKPNKKDDGASSAPSTSSLEKRKSELAKKSGQWVHFGNKTKYPKVWFKKIIITSESNENQDLGDFQGVIKNFTTEPYVINKPLTFEINGSVQSVPINGLKISGVMDYTNPQKPKEDINLNLGSFPVSGLEIIESSKYAMIIKEAIGATSLSTKLVDEKIEIKLEQLFKSPKWELNYEKSSSESLHKILDAIKGMQQDLSLRAQVTGTFKDPNVKLASNFGTIIKEAIEKNLSQRLQSSLEKRKAELSEKLGPEFSPYIEKLDVLSGDLSQTEKQFDEIKDELKDKLEKKLKLDDKTKEKLKKAKDKLFDKIGL